MGQGTSDKILGVIWIIWIQATRCVYVQDKSKTYDTDFDEIFRICLKR